MHTARVIRGAAIFSFVAATFVATSCGSDGSGASGGDCQPGATRECIGPGACKGGQTCTGDQQWSACDCGISGTGGTGASGGAGGSGGSPGGGGGTPAGGTGGTGGSSGDASSTGGTAGDASADAVDSGILPGDDPCPTEPVFLDCSDDCGGPSTLCTSENDCMNGYTFANPLPAPQKYSSHLVARTPSHPGPGNCPVCVASQGYMPSTYSMQFTYQGPQVGTWIRVTVGKPWMVRAFKGPGTGACVSSDSANGCIVKPIQISSSEQLTFVVATDDPNAPARNVILDWPSVTDCQLSEYWQ